MSFAPLGKADEESPFLDDPNINPADYVRSSAPWVVGRAYSVVPLQPLLPTLFLKSAFVGKKFNFYCIIRGIRTGVVIDPQAASSYVQGYPNSFMVKVKSQGEALRLYNASLLNKDVAIVRKATPFDRSFKNPWAVICVLLVLAILLLSYIH